MSDLGDNTMSTIAPLTVHRIGESARVIICEGGANAECHVYPDCDCEYWDHEEGTDKHRHPSVPHATCWAIEWTNATDLSDSSDDELFGDQIVPGRVELTWEGDYVLWRYAPETTDSETSR